MAAGTVMANWGRQIPVSEMSDEQRRAMFWRMGQGPWSRRPTAQEMAATPAESAYGLTLGLLGKAVETVGTSAAEPAGDYKAKLEAAGVTVYDGKVPSWWDKFKAGVSGFFEGAKTGEIYNPDPLIIYKNPPTKWDAFKAAADGFIKGAYEGLVHFDNFFTLGLNDNFRKQSESYPGSKIIIPGLSGLRITDTGLSKKFAYYSATAAHWALFEGALGWLGAAWKAQKGFTGLNRLGAAFAAQAPKVSALKSIPILTTVGGFTAQSEINDFREGRALSYNADKWLARAADLAGFTGGMGLAAMGIGAIGAIARKIPVSPRASLPFRKALAGWLAPPAKAAVAQAKSLTPGRRLSLLGAARAGLATIDRGAHVIAKGIGKHISPVVKTPLKTLYGWHTAFSDFTGSTLKDITNLPKTLQKLGKAKALVAQGAAKTARAESIMASAGSKIFATPKFIPESTVFKPSGFSLEIDRTMPAKLTGQLQKGTEQIIRAASEKIKALLKLGTPSAKGAARTLAKTAKEAQDGINQIAAHAKNLGGITKPINKLAQDAMLKAEKAMVDATQKLIGLTNTKFGMTQKAARFLKDGNRNFTEGVNLYKQAHLEANALRSSAARLTREAGYLTEAAKEGLKKAAYVAGMASGTYAIGELGIGPKGAISDKLGFGKGEKTYYKEIWDAQERGEPFTKPLDPEQSGVAKGAAIVIGSTGNPVEKLMRAGWAEEQADNAAYHVALDRLALREKNGTISKAEADRLRQEAAKNKPRKLGGRGIWDVVTAIGSFAKWRGGEIVDKAKRQTFQTIRGTDVNPDYLHDADTFHTVETPHGIRASGYNAPETWEPLGIESRDYARKFIKPGQTILVTEDSHPQARIPFSETRAGIEETAKKENWSEAKLQTELNKLAGYGKNFGRPVASAGVLPTGLNWTLKVPYLRRATALFTQDVGKKVIKAGLADMRYGVDILPSGRVVSGLSGPTDMDAAYDKARQAPKAAGKGIWNPNLLADSPELKKWVGQQEGPAEIKAARWKAMYGDKPMPKTPWGNFNTAYGQGLMYSGNLRAPVAMPRVGQALMWAYNSVLAASGPFDKAEKRAWKAALPDFMRQTKTVKGIPTDYDAYLTELRRERAKRNKAQ